MRRRVSLPVFLLVLLLSSFSTRGENTQPMTQESEANIEEIQRFFNEQGKQVITFIGYSGSGYEDQPTMLRIAAGVLDEYDPSDTIVNIGATPGGIGAVYELAKQRGFSTTGIVSTQAREYNAGLSQFADHVFYVADKTWGGFLDGTQQLSPTSQVMVAVSDVMIGIGGGEVGRDELLSARSAGKQVRFYPAEFNHDVARKKARDKGLSEPTDFGGAAAAAFEAKTDP